jgi:protease-4
MRYEDVDSVGQGRVWSGNDAIGIGLVDALAGLSASIDSAAALAGVDKYSIKELPVQEEPYARLISQLSGDTKMRLLKKELGESFRFINELRAIKDLSGVQARLPYFIDIH